MSTMTAELVICPEDGEVIEVWGVERLQREEGGWEYKVTYWHNGPIEEVALSRDISRIHFKRCRVGIDLCAQFTGKESGSKPLVAGETRSFRLQLDDRLAECQLELALFGPQDTTYFCYRPPPVQ